jgi:hypothetical protein
MRRLLSLPVPICNLTNLAQSEEFYRMMETRFRSAGDMEESGMARQRSEQAAIQYVRTRNKERPPGMNCPESHLDKAIRRMQGP